MKRSLCLRVVVRLGSVGVLALLVASLSAPIASAANANVVALNTNVLINKGAEAGGSSPDGNSAVAIPGWTHVLGFTVVEYGSGNGFPDAGDSAPIHGGAQFFTAGHDLASACGEAWQDVSLAGRESQVDNGHLRAVLSADIATYGSQIDEGGLKLQYLDANKSLILERSTALISKTSDTFKPVSAAAVIPSGTRTLRVLMYTTKHQGSYCDAYFDNVSLTLRPALGFRFVAAGYQHSCAIRSDSTVWCWGLDYAGQLGDGTTGDKLSRRLLPVEVMTGDGKPFTGALQLAAGQTHTCARTSAGVVWCWGANNYGQLGDGTTGDAKHVRLHPVRVRQGSSFLGGIKEITALGTATCALKTDGHVWCWGSNISGELGDGTNGDANNVRLKPVRVLAATAALANVVHIGSGTSHACAVRSNGTVWCWGNDMSGQLGDGSHGPLATSRRAVAVLGQGGPLKNAVSVDGAQSHTCARLANATAVCWGSDMYGQLGDGTTGDGSHFRLSPVTVKLGSAALGGVVAITTGDLSTCAVRATGAVMCWGYAASGQLGDGTTGDAQNRRLSPVTVVGSDGNSLARITAAASGSAHVCALRAKGAAAGTVWCWGSNGYGQIGDGTTGNPNHSQLRAAQSAFR